MSGQLNILLVDDEQIVHETIGDYLMDCGHRFKSCREGDSALIALGKDDYDLAIIDVKMPGLSGLELLERARKTCPETSIVMITGHGNMEMVIEALRSGAADFLPKPVKLLELEAVLEKVARLGGLEKDKRHLKQTIGGIQSSALRESACGFMGASPNAESVCEQIDLAIEARVDSVLITGETGTGKEVVARELHFKSGNPDRPFIPVSCPALPEALVESELFGHAKGAFTGATTDKPGYFELADGGTLFLDEIADLSADAQAKVLRALETRSFRRVGRSKEISVNLTVVAASNAPLEDAVAEGRFRSDLFYRLNVFPIELAPLNQRPEDVMPIAEQFLAVYATQRGVSEKSLTQDAKEYLLDYAFPGNVRELRNMIERAAILSRSGDINAAHLGRHNGHSKVSTAKMIPSESFGERDSILTALEEAKWNRKAAAVALDIPYSTLRYKIQKYQIA